MIGTAAIRNQGFTIALTAMAERHKNTNCKNLCIEMQSFCVQPILHFIKLISSLNTYMHFS